MVATVSTVATGAVNVNVAAGMARVRTIVSN